VKYLLDKLLFRDIKTGNVASPSSNVHLAKAIALALILLTFLSGTFLTAKHALNYYNGSKAVFLAAANPPEQPKTIDHSAAWFTQELGDPYQIQGILVYLNDYEGQTLTLDIVNVNDISVELLSVHDNSSLYEYPIEGNTDLSPSSIYESHSYAIKNVDDRMLKVRSEIFVKYKYDDCIIRQAPVIPFKRFDEDVYESTSIRTIDNTSQFEFIEETESYVFFNDDQITIDQPLYIPGGKPLYIFAGQKLDFVDQAFLLARTEVHFSGDEEKPISVFSSDGTGRGIFISQAGGRSTISHTIFDGLDVPKSGVWSLTGAVTFYESDVDIDHSEFINNNCEDGLNIIRSDFTITNSYFADTFSDAFDADFCTGVISESVFSRTGNDAVDASGSQLKIIDTDMAMIGDKGISGGEHSQINIENLHIEDAVIGIASKDLSLITGENISVSNSMIGITLYEKKAEFGPAFVDISNFHITGQVDLDYLIQQKSILKIDGQVVLPRSAAKESLLFDKMIAGEPIQ